MNITDAHYTCTDTSRALSEKIKNAPAWMTFSTQLWHLCQSKYYSVNHVLRTDPFSSPWERWKNSEMKRGNAGTLGLGEMYILYTGSP